MPQQTRNKRKSRELCFGLGNKQIKT
jgi:hypothetical protein